jgi:predicted transcriptional regulator of viral defense system
MKLIEVREGLAKLNLPAFTLQDVVGVFQIEKTHASHLMTRLTHSGSFVKVKRGLWAWPDTDPLALTSFLTSPFLSYVSLQTALFYHGIIEQVPAYLYVITLGRKQKQITPFGTFSMHHINVNFFTGFETHYNPFYQIATPEKAMLDYLYMGRIEPRLFGALPEIDIRSLKVPEMKKMINLIEHLGTRSYLNAKLDLLI